VDTINEKKKETSIVTHRLTSSYRALDRERALSGILDELNPVIRRSELNYFLEVRPAFATIVHSRVSNSFTAEPPSPSIVPLAGETPPKTRNFLSFDSVVRSEH